MLTTDQIEALAALEAAQASERTKLQARFANDREELTARHRAEKMELVARLGLAEGGGAPGGSTGPLEPGNTGPSRRLVVARPNGGQRGAGG